MSAPLSGHFSPKQWMPSAPNTRDTIAVVRWLGDAELFCSHPSSSSWNPSLLFSVSPFFGQRNCFHSVLLEAYKITNLTSKPLVLGSVRILCYLFIREEMTIRANGAEELCGGRFRLPITMLVFSVADVKTSRNQTTELFFQRIPVSLCELLSM